MILNNTQANIFKVNGGIADNFANRPAASGSFYIFYSIDTQEIYYDNGAWILIGSGGGAVNIYNSDGTLTSPRTLLGNYTNLYFLELGTLKFSNYPLDYGYYQDLNTIKLGDYANNYLNGTYFEIQGGIIKTSNQGNDNGLKLDFANQEYYLGDPQTQFSVYTNISNRTIYIGDQGGNFNGTVFDLNDVAQNIQTLGGGNTAGIRLNFINSNYILGQYQGNNTSFLEVDDTNQIIKTSNQGNDIGLKLYFANSVYQFGQITGGNNAFIEIDDTRPRIGTKFFGSNFNDGIEIVGNEYSDLGFNNTVNQIKLRVSDISNEITTRDFNGVNGLRLDYTNKSFKFGYFTIPSNLWLDINNTNKIVKIVNDQFDKGLKLDFAQRRYQLGQINGNNNTTFVIEDVQGGIFCLYQNIGIGFAFQGNASIYKYGQINGGNQTIFTIADGAAYPVQLDGTNITSGTAGGASGQHLKIKINGVDYKIELKNP